MGPRDGTRITQADDLSEMIYKTVEAMAVLTMIGGSGPNRHPIRGWFIGLWRWIRPLDEKKLLAEAGFDQEEIESLTSEESD